MKKITVNLGCAGLKEKDFVIKDITILPNGDRLFRNIEVYEKYIKKQQGHNITSETQFKRQ